MHTLPECLHYLEKKLTKTFITEHAGNNLIYKVALQFGRIENIILTLVNPS